MSQERGHADGAVDSIATTEMASLDDRLRSPDDHTATVERGFLRLQADGTAGYRLVPLGAITDLEISGIGGHPPTQLVVRTASGASISLAGSAPAVETVVQAIRDAFAARSIV